MPKVSICIPTYKQVEYLKKTLDSIRVQDFTDYEIIVSDDSPDDSVKNVLKEYDFKGKLNYFYNSPALGAPANWNFAMNKAVGDYIKIMHHDDYFTSSQSLKKFVKLLDDAPHASFAFSSTTIYLLSLNASKTHKCSSGQLKKILNHPDVLFFANYIGAPSATIVRNKNNVLFDTHLKWLVDIEWYYRLIINNAHVANTSEELICTVHGAKGQITQSVITDKDIQIKEHIYFFQKVFSNTIDFKKYSIFFQLLFDKYNLNDFNELNAVYTISEEMKPFFLEVLRLKNDNIFIKRVVYWLKRSSLNDHVFTLKKIFR